MPKKRNKPISFDRIGADMAKLMDLQRSVDQLLKLVGEFLFVGGSAVAIAVGVFPFLGRSWIENKFKERLETFRHEQAIELQRLRVQIESMLGGALKLQELEFKVLPEAWKKLDDAYGRVGWVTSSLQLYPKIDGMSDSELSEYFTKNHPDFLDSQVNSVINASGLDRDNRYQELLSWQRINRARKAVNEIYT